MCSGSVQLGRLREIAETAMEGSESRFSFRALDPKFVPLANQCQKGLDLRAKWNVVYLKMALCRWEGWLRKTSALWLTSCTMDSLR